MTELSIVDLPVELLARCLWASGGDLPFMCRASTVAGAFKAAADLVRQQI
jgi:hypothetical protein